MHIAWAGNHEFETLLRERLPKAILLREANQAPHERCACLLVQGLDEAPAHFQSVPLVRLVTQQHLDALSKIQGPLGIVVLETESGEPSLENLLLTYAARATSLRIDEVVRGPVAHDVRGAVGIIHLAKQVLEASGESNAVGTRLESAVTKIQHLLEDLEVVARSPIQPPNTLHETSTWREAFAETKLWQEAVHRRRQVEVSLSDQFGSRTIPTNAKYILRAMLDASLRLTNPSTVITVVVDLRDSAWVLRSECELESADDELRRFAAAPMSEAALPQGKSFLFRLRKAAELVEGSEGAIAANIDDGKFSLVVTLPSES